MKITLNVNGKAEIPVVFDESLKDAELIDARINGLAGAEANQGINLTDGKLVGVPGYKGFYHEALERDKWGLIAARVESYKGFVFATMDREAPALDEYLGEVGRVGLSMADRKSVV